MVTLRQLEQNEALAACFNNCPALAVQDIVGVQFRNLATVGGSIYGRYGFSDVLTVLLSLDTYVELYKGGILPLEEYAAMAYDRDILVRLIVKKHPGRFTYLAMRNSRTDFPVLTCALSLMEGEYRAVIGARPGKAMVIRDTRGLLADGINQQSAKAFADYVADTVPTQSNLRGSSAYRTHLARVLTERGLMNLEDNNGN
jgi:CO/xanthine dehydrogenase FAD-binding subunit